jgi:hypothetical protein
VSGIPLVLAAEMYARLAHYGQVDKAGEPYARHPARVVDTLIRRGVTDEITLAAAWLHDVVEDTAVSIAEIIRMFGLDVARLVNAVSREPGEDPASYYARIVAEGTAAVEIKEADIADNSDPDRLALLPEAVADRLRTKYHRALIALHGNG